MKRYRLLLSLTSICVAAYAQVRSASLHGVARLEGIPAPQANIVIRSLEDQTTHVVISRSDGSFLIEDLDPGRYELSATKVDAGTAGGRPRSNSASARI